MTLAATTARETALAVLSDWLADGRFPDRLLAAAHPRHALITELVYGAVRWRRALEWAIATRSDRRPADAALPALLLGAYQILCMRVPDHAAVNETVRAFRAMQPRGPAGYVNAVLRRIARERSAIELALAAQPPGIRWSHPDALVARWTARWGPADTEALCRWNNQPADTAVRPRGPGGLAALTAAWARAGIAAAPHPADPERFLLAPRGRAVTDCPGFAEGRFAVHDPATAVAVDLLQVEPTHRVLDACAAPGGKAAMLADVLDDPARLVAVDVHADRLALLRETLARLGLAHVTVVAADLAAPAAVALPGGTRFDRILADVPCTNTGVLRRRPDARWRFSAARLARLTALQERLLDRCAAWLTPGGRLVYSTCSIEPEENERQIARWLARHADFRPAGRARRLPPGDACDGAFAAAIERR